MDNYRLSKWLVSFIVLIPLLVFPYQKIDSKVVKSNVDDTETIESLRSSHTALSGDSGKLKPEKLSTTQNNDEQIDLSHSKIVSITEQFMELIVQETDTDYKVKNYKTKDALIKDFKELADRSVVEKYVDFYYEENNGNLYIIPTETPPWFQNESDYEMMYLSDNKVKIIQKNYNDLYGEYTLELELTFNEKWRISNTKHS
ncbi:hypothetical protein [Aquibacillus saliphilus]|uniref:hypothetical protein n=1 Tax=Aquibacillus saliphilus TaxID=1909422 RepID=UPI001CF01A5B|nr:hypothetical protein [Aquibacillus saliphilus]